mgnify:CR=1 FL=1
MKVIILAGGYGTRLGTITENIPKPMVNIGDKPILIHLMESFASYGYTDFHIALGYKSEYIVDFFNTRNFKWQISLHDTGLDTATGGRAKLITAKVKSDKYFLTYGDGLSDVNLNKLEQFHNSHNKLATVTAVHPPARFGELHLDGSIVTSFEEKPQLQRGWINGGFFVFEREFFDNITTNTMMIEREPLELVTKSSNLYAFKHEGFWQCMDTPRDKKYLEELYKDDSPWIKAR